MKPVKVRERLLPNRTQFLSIARPFGINQMPSTRPDLKFENQEEADQFLAKLRNDTYTSVAGLDECGRGSYAGPVVAACVLLKPDHGIKGIRDSKRLSPRRRAVLAEQIMANSWWALGSRDNYQIDELNVYKATLESAAAAAIKCLYKGAPIDFLLCDGGLVLETTVPFPTVAVIKGDDWYECVGAASIVAKVHRDNLMAAYHEIWPEYGFNTNAGYGTKVHISAIHKYGMIDIHRRSYGICKTAKVRGNVR